MEVKKMSWEEIKLNHNKDEGLVILGAGGDLNDWINGIFKDLKEYKVTDSDKPEDIFKEVILTTSSGGRHDLHLIFSPDGKIDMGKLAIWRLIFRDCSWLSDWFINYADHYYKTESLSRTIEFDIKFTLNINNAKNLGEVKKIFAIIVNTMKYDENEMKFDNEHYLQQEEFEIKRITDNNGKDCREEIDDISDF